MTRNLALGGDFMVQKMQGRTGTAMTFGARYKADDCIATATLGTAQANFEASYFQKVNEQTAVTANLQISLAERATKTIVGWQQTLTQSILFVFIRKLTVLSIEFSSRWRFVSSNITVYHIIAVDKLTLTAKLSLGSSTICFLVCPFRLMGC